MEGSLVKIDLHGTPVTGRVVRAPLPPDTWWHDDCDYWLVDVAGFGVVEVIGGHAI